MRKTKVKLFFSLLVEDFVYYFSTLNDLLLETADIAWKNITCIVCNRKHWALLPHSLKLKSSRSFLIFLKLCDKWSWRWCICFILFCKSLIFLCLTADCRAISMGQGQEIHARKLVGQFMQTVCSLLHSGFRLYKHNTFGEIVCVCCC